MLILQATSPLSVSDSIPPGLRELSTNKLASNTASSPLSPDAGPTGSDLPGKDFGFLLDPAAYHVLPATNVPAPFLNAPNLPANATPLPVLLKTGHYRLAAITAARALVSGTSPSDSARIFHLFHTRLACLCLINEHALAAQESKLLGDLSSSFYRHPVTNVHIVPWELRVLAVRLAALGYGEWRKGIMGYYELAREARENVIKSQSNEEKELWRSRLRECGIRVANVLVEMGELEGAGRHLATLAAVEPSQAQSQQVRDLLIMEALVWLRVGDIKGARHCLSTATSISEDEKLDGALSALIAMADSDFLAAISKWQELHNAYPEDAMITQNLAVVLLYTDRISETRDLLTELTDTSPPFHSLIFNLCTIFELCTERNRDKKLALATKLATRDGGSEREVGWEIGAAEFKL